MPVVVFLRSKTLTDVPQDRVTAFRQGLKEVGFVEGQNVAIEIHSSGDQRLPLLVADLLRRRVAVIVANTPSALALKIGVRMLSETVRADAREGDIGMQLGEIAKANPEVSHGIPSRLLARKFLVYSKLPCLELLSFPQVQSACQ
jgi:putative ABC transport system substrate-binding protein